jgi:hypothetical protein
MVQGDGHDGRMMVRGLRPFLPRSPARPFVQASERPQPRREASLSRRCGALRPKRPQRGRHPAQQARLQDAADESWHRPAHGEEHASGQESHGHRTESPESGDGWKVDADRTWPDLLFRDRARQFRRHRTVIRPARTCRRFRRAMSRDSCRSLPRFFLPPRGCAAVGTKRASLAAFPSGHRQYLPRAVPAYPDRRSIGFTGSAE